MVNLGVLDQRDDAGIGPAGHHPDREDGIARGDAGGVEGGRPHDQAADVVQVDLHAVAVQQGVTAIRAIQAQGVAHGRGVGQGRAVRTIARQIAEDAAEVHRGGGAVLGRGVAIGLGVLGGQQNSAFAGGADGHARPVIVERQRRELIRCDIGIEQAEFANVEGGVEVGVVRADVVDQHPVVQAGGGVGDLVVVFQALDHHGIFGERDRDAAQRGGGRSNNALVKHQGLARNRLRAVSGGLGGDGDRPDLNRSVVVQVVDEVLARVRLIVAGVGSALVIKHGRKGADLQCGFIARCHLGNGKIGPIAAVERSEGDVGLHVRFVLVQVGNRVVGVGPRREGEVQAGAFHDLLAVGTQGGFAATFAGVDGVAVGDGRSIGFGLVDRVLAGDDDHRVGRAGGSIAEHQEQVLACRRTFQRELAAIADRDAEVVQAQGVVGVGGNRVLDFLVLHQPHLGAHGVQIGGQGVTGSVRGLQVRGEDDVA